MQVDILPPETPPPLRKLAEQVAKVLAADKDNALLQPWFTTPAIAQEIRRQQTVAERFKFSDYYEKYGCIHCETTDRPHAGNGFCLRCRSWLTTRLKQCMKERQQERAKRG